MKIEVRICFKIPGEDVTLTTTAEYTVKELVDFIKTSYSIKCIAHIWINGKKFHFGGAL